MITQDEMMEQLQALHVRLKHSEEQRERLLFSYEQSEKEVRRLEKTNKELMLAIKSQGVPSPNARVIDLMRKGDAEK